ncbi:MAG: acyl-CoA reductase [Microscillaceae bacterium]
MASVLQKAESENRWFTAENLQTALANIQSGYLEEARLRQWLEPYASQLAQPRTVKKIGVVMAGNIPLVGFHDLLCVLISGHFLLAKPSAQDRVLMQLVMDILGEISPALKDRMQVAEQLREADAYIATGSDNTARHFAYYFQDKPHIIRRNRHAVAVLNGNESETQLRALGQDIFLYFGLGCRSVSKIFLPQGYDPTYLIPIWEKDWGNLAQHNKYGNNYDYHRAIYIMNGDDYFEASFLILRESSAIASPMANLFYEYYQDEADLNDRLARDAEKIQIIIGSPSQDSRFVPFGQAQAPSLADYADGVDTLGFLLSLG